MQKKAKGKLGDEAKAKDCRGKKLLKISRKLQQPGLTAQKRAALLAKFDAQIEAADLPDDTAAQPTVNGSSGCPTSSRMLL